MFEELRRGPYILWKQWGNKWRGSGWVKIYNPTALKNFFFFQYVLSIIESHAYLNLGLIGTDFCL